MYLLLLIEGVGFSNIIVDLYTYLYNYISFCLTYFDALLLGAYALRIMSFWNIDPLLCNDPFISANFPSSKVGFV